jgi:hypothetical protein
MMTVEMEFDRELSVLNCLISFGNVMTILIRILHVMI